MNTKEIVLTSIAAVAVAIISGVAVAMLTKDPPKKEDESLLYSTEKPVRIDGKNLSLTSQRVVIRNDGTKPSENINLRFSTGKNVQCVSLDVKSGLQGKVAHSGISLPGYYEVHFPKLLPTEKAIVTTVFKGEIVGDLLIDVRSDGLLGKLEDAASNTSIETDSVFSSPVIATISSIIASLSLAIVLFAIRGKGLIRSLEAEGNVHASNSAFVLAHFGLVPEAKSILTALLETGNMGPLAMANYGLVLGLEGNAVGAESMFRCSDFYGRGDKRVRTVIAFNKACIAAKEGKKMEAVDLIKSAHQLDKKETELYVNGTVWLEQIKKESQDIIAMNSR